MDGRTDRWMDGQTEEQTDRRTDGRMDGWMDRQESEWPSTPSVLILDCSESQCGNPKLMKFAIWQDNNHLTDPLIEIWYHIKQAIRKITKKKTDVIMTVVTCIHVTLTVEEQGSCLKQLWISFRFWLIFYTQFWLFIIITPACVSRFLKFVWVSKTRENVLTGCTIPVNLSSAIWISSSFNNADYHKSRTDAISHFAKKK